MNTKEPELSFILGCRPTVPQCESINPCSLVQPDLKCSQMSSFPSLHPFFQPLISAVRLVAPSASLKQTHTSAVWSKTVIICWITFKEQEVFSSNGTREP